MRARFSALLTLTALLAASGVRAQTVTKIPAWTEAGFSQDWVAEGRIGGGDHEADLGLNTSGTFVSANFTWPQNTAVPFTLQYSGGTATFQVGAGGSLASLTYAIPTAAQDFTDLFIRVAAFPGDPGTTRTMEIANLAYNGSALTIPSISQTNGGGDALHLDGFNPNAGFTLTGTARFSWTGTRPQRSNMAFQIKAGNQNRIPEPGTLALATLAGVAGVALARRRK
jgi:hypothetical protein